MNTISINIKNRMLNQQLKVAALEKKSGLSTSSIYNVLKGRTKSPTIDVLIPIARALGCTVSDLTGEETLKTEQDQKDKIYEERWNEKLYVSVLLTVANMLENSPFPFKKEDVDQLIREVYKYSSRIGQNTADKNFSGWMIEKFLADKNK